jgi:hypothetical protein
MLVTTNVTTPICATVASVSEINDITFVDEEMYTEPVVMRGVWDYSPDTPVLEYVCAEEIWDHYIETLSNDGVRLF